MNYSYEHFSESFEAKYFFVSEISPTTFLQYFFSEICGFKISEKMTFYGHSKVVDLLLYLEFSGNGGWGFTLEGRLVMDGGVFGCGDHNVDH